MHKPTHFLNRIYPGAKIRNFGQILHDIWKIKALFCYLLYGISHKSSTAMCKKLCVNVFWNQISKDFWNLLLVSNLWIARRPRSCWILVDLRSRACNPCSRLDIILIIKYSQNNCVIMLLCKLWKDVFGHIYCCNFLEANLQIMNTIASRRQLP